MVRTKIGLSWGSECESQMGKMGVLEMYVRPMQITNWENALKRQRNTREVQDRMLNGWN